MTKCSECDGAIEVITDNQSFIDDSRTGTYRCTKCGLKKFWRSEPVYPEPVIDMSDA